MVRQPLRPPLQVVQHLQAEAQREKEVQAWAESHHCVGENKRRKGSLQWEKKVDGRDLKVEDEVKGEEKNWEFGLAEFRSKGLLDLGERIREKVPAYRYSAAFVSTLRQNLVLSSSLYPDSPTYNPIMPPSSPPTSSPLPPAASSMPTTPTAMTASPSAVDTSDPLASLPPLTTHLATTSEEKLWALKLVADSVAQQRQLAAYYLITHTYTLSAFALVLAMIARILYNTPASLFTTLAGITMTMLVSVRWAVGGYLALAEAVNWEWLADDEVIITEYGPNVIGALVFRVEKEGSGKKKKARGVIRAWTVRRRERGRGIGRALLEEVVRICAERGCEGVGFAEDHVNAANVIHEWFRKGWRVQEEGKARMCLRVVEREGGLGRRKSR